MIPDEAMNKAQLIGIAVAILAGGGAFFMLSEMNMSPAPMPAIISRSNLDKGLVAKRDLPYGLEVSDQDTNWIDWPAEAVPEGVLSKSRTPRGQEEIKGAFVHVPVSKGEPIRMERIAKSGATGAMATMLPSGKRAVAVDVTLNNTAGGFILPNDRVDVVRTYRDPDASRQANREIFNSEVVLPNMRVLAMGQTIEKKNNETVVTGSTATLKVDPQQAHTLIVAQKSGQLTLVLRSIRDAIPKAAVVEEGPKPVNTLTIVKYGVSSDLVAR
jgi:pilus assembly protein CpaB